MRGWRSRDFGFCETPEVLIGLRCDQGGGGSGGGAVAEPRCWNWGCASRWRAIPLAVVAVLGTREARPFGVTYLNRSVFRHFLRRLGNREPPCTDRRTVVWQGSGVTAAPADVCWACLVVWRCKSSGQPDGGEGLVRTQGLPPRGGV